MAWWQVGDLTITTTSGTTTDASERPLSAARGSAFSLIGTAVGAIANFAMLVLIGNRFGPEAFGVFSGATALFLLAGVVFRLGGDTGATWFLAQIVEEGRIRSARGAVRVALAPVVVGSMAAGALGFGLASTLASVLTDGAGQDEYATMLRIFAIVLPVATAGEVLMGATRGLGSMRPTVLASQLGRQVGQLVTVALVLLLGGSLTAVAVAWAVPYLITVVYPAVWLRARLPRAGQSDMGDRGRYWRFTIPQAANSAAQSGLEKFDVIALGFLVGTAAQGEYSVANRMAHVVVLGWYAINLAQAPIYARLFAAGRDRELRHVVQTVSGWAVVVVAPVLWIYVVFPRVVARLFGPEFESGGDALIILAGALLAALLFGPSENLLLMSGRSSRAFANNVVALSANIALNLILVPQHGIRGAAFAWLVTLLFARGTAAVQVATERGVYALGRPLVEAWLAVAVCFGGLGAVVRLSVGATFGALVFTVVGGAVLLATVLVVRRESMRFDALVAALFSSDRPPPAGGLTDQRHLERGPHLRLALRSAVVVAQDDPMASRSRAVAAIQVGGWKGKLVRGSVGRLFATLPGQTPRLLPFITRTEGADLPIPAAVAAGAVGDALDRLDEPTTGVVDGVVWLVPPRSDGARAAALLVAAGEPVAHLRVSTDLAPSRPSPIVLRGARTGIEWPMILDRWTRDGLEVELSSIVDIGPHEATEIGLNTLLGLVEDLQEALAGDGSPRWTTPMHGDLTPWNLRRAGDRLVLFDWEHRCFGPRDGDLVRYLATTSDGLELFEELPAVRRRGAIDAIEWYSDLAIARRDRSNGSRATSRWKARDRAEEIDRLVELARRSR